VEPPFYYMTSLRTVIFIDGENFRNNLRHFIFVSNPTLGEYRLEEKHFFWRKFFQGVLQEFDNTTGWQHQLVRVYWYYSATISPWAESPRLAQKVVDDNVGRISLTANQVTQLAKDWYDKERRYFEKLREHTFEEIQRDTGFLEFKYVGQYIVHPYRVFRIDTDSRGNVTNYLGQQQGEKGVDIGIAVDMISKMDNYDAAILISGDADYIPAVKYLKDHLKYIYQFSIARGVPPKIEYLSAYLKGSADCFAYYDEIRLLSNYLDRKNIPPTICQAIDARIASLTPPPPTTPPTTPIQP
jgi:uncharacterized LabA/DUF88 family protein